MFIDSLLRRAVLPLLCAGLCQGLSGFGMASAQDKPATLPPLAPADAVPMTNSGAMAAPGQISGLVLYSGQSADQAGLTVTAWGGGSAGVAADRAFAPGKNSIKIVTRGLYQGGRLTLASPIALGDLTADKTRYLQLALGFVSAAPDGDSPDGSPQAPGVQMPPSQDQQQDQQESFAPSAAHVFTADGHPGLFRLAQGPYRGGPPPGFRPPVGPPPGFRPPGVPGAPGTARPRSDDETLDIVQPPIKSLHLTFAFADGSETDVVRPIPALEQGENWLQLGIPLSQVPVPPSQAHDAHLQSVTIAGDAPTTLYIGQVRMISDNLPITCSTGGEQDVARGDTVVLKGKAQGGASNLHYEWDFDTKGDFVSQAEGREVTHVYTQSGSYKVTLRVSDVDGIKAAATSSTDIHIED